MAFTSVTTKITTAWNATEISQVLSGGAGTGDLVFAGDLPFGSAHIVLTSGTAVTNVQLTVANDGLVGTQTIPVLKNPVSLGAAVTTLPNIIDLATGSIVAAGPSSVGAGFAQTPYKFFQFIVTGGDATSVVTITMVFMGTRG